MRKTRPSLVAALVAGSLAIAAPAQAETVDVTGAAADSNLALTLATPVAMTLTPGATSNTLGAVNVLATGNWFLWVKDNDAGTPGQLDLLTNAANTTNGCAGASAASLTNPMSVYGTGTVASALGSLSIVRGSGNPISLTNSYAKIAQGSLAQVVTANYGVVVPTNEQLKSLCQYGTTLTYTATASDAAPGA